mgnify:CR=1 FL=1
MRKVILGLTIIIPILIILFLHFFGTNHYALKGGRASLLDATDSVVLSEIKNIMQQSGVQYTDKSAIIINMVKNRSEVTDMRLADYMKRHVDAVIYRIWVVPSKDSIFLMDNYSTHANQLKASEFFKDKKVNQKYYLINPEMTIQRVFEKYNDKHLDTLMMETSILTNEHKHSK